MSQNENELVEQIQPESEVQTLSEEYESENKNAQEQSTQIENEPLSEDILSFAQAELENLAAKYDTAPANLEELWASAQCEQLMGLWAKGLSLEQAYCAINAKALIQRERDTAQQAALAKLNGKSHLAPFGGTDDVVCVPEEVRNIYEKMLPHMTDAQIRSEYKKYVSDL